MKPKIVEAYERFGEHDTYDTPHATVQVKMGDEFIFYVSDVEGLEGEDGTSITEMSEDEFFKKYSLIPGYLLNKYRVIRNKIFSPIEESKR